MSSVKAAPNPEEIVLELTQSEIWDDSTLVEAWDEAMGEYKVRLPVVSGRVWLMGKQKYHSIAATGEDPTVLVETMEKGVAVPVTPSGGAEKGEAKIIGPAMPKSEVQGQPRMEVDVEGAPLPAVVEEPETKAEIPEAVETTSVEPEPAVSIPAASPATEAAPFPFSVQHPAGPAAGYAVGGSE